MNYNYFQNSEAAGFSSAEELIVREKSVATLMRNVYLWMTLALVVTGMTAFYLSESYAFLNLIGEHPFIFWGAIIGEFALVLSLSAAIQKLSFPVAGVLFIVYSILNGVTLSLVFMVYTEASIATTFYIAAGTFAGMALVGSFVKKDLSAIGRILIMALIGLIIATVVNMFLNSSGLDLVISYAGVLIFVGLTAFDAQKIKNLLIQSQNYTEENQMKLALSGSLMLYLDFVNLFLYLLRIFGDRK